MNTPESIWLRLSGVIRETFNVPLNLLIERTTSSAEIAGWDSLSYSVLIMEIEEVFDVRFDFDQIFALSNVGELADAIRTLL